MHKEAPLGEEACWEGARDVVQYLGIDVAKASLEVAGVGGVARCENSVAGIALLRAALEQRHAAEPVQVILEPTSTYHHRLVEALRAAGIPSTLVNPARAAAFAVAQGRRNKTDAVDARVLQQFGQQQRPEPAAPLEPEQEGLKALRRHQEWLEGEVRAAKNRLEAAEASPWTPAGLLQSLRRAIAEREAEVERVETEERRYVDEHPKLRFQVGLLLSIPSVGWKSALVVLSECPPVERCRSAKSWVGYCGLHPARRQSGKKATGGLSRQGPAHVRSVLYMTGVVALRWNAAVRDLGERLRGRGKTGLELVVAAMHKVLRQCFGVLAHGQPFDPGRAGSRVLVAA
jgi:transposase